MPAPCAACTSPHARTIDAKIRAGESFVGISAWLTLRDAAITRNAISRHARSHLGIAPGTPGPKPVSGDLLERVRDDALARLEAGEIRATLRDGIGAVKALDARAARNADRDLMLRIAIALTGGGQRQLPPPDPEREAIEAEYRVYLDGGTPAEAGQAVAALIGAGHDD